MIPRSDVSPQAKFRTYVSHTQEWQPVMDVWMSLMHSSTERDFGMQLAYFEQMCLPFDMFLNYVKNTWLIPHKEKFVDAWINKVMHLGMTTTNRVESAHSRLKNMLQDSRGLVSRDALALIDDEKQHINYVGINSSACGCTLRNTHGLPCACQPECDEVLRRFEELDLSSKVVLKSKMREHVDAMYSQHESSSTHTAAFQSRPRCKKQVTILDQFPLGLHPFIVRVEDVEADGNCGYRAIAASLGFGQDSWPVIHDDLSRELQHYRAQYIKLFGGVDRYNRLRMSLFVDCGKTVSVDKWMTLPNMGYIIASRYNLVLISLLKPESMTFFPLRGHPISSHQIICIGYVYGNHFVQVELKDGCPIPPPHCKAVGIESSARCRGLGVSILRENGCIYHII
ncbi:PKS-NRPS hybrid synthetase [Sesbania bispinosa]|nr:PKS-NRPS hybrid synthetase [Sesbania bispinosa]